MDQDLQTTEVTVVELHRVIMDEGTTVQPAQYEPFFLDFDKLTQALVVYTQAYVLLVLNFLRCCFFEVKTYFKEETRWHLLGLAKESFELSFE
jgi:hypothetical protein